MSPAYWADFVKYKEKFVKKLLALAPIALLLSACATDGTTNGGVAPAHSLGMAAMSIAVQAKCINELENNSYWRTASRALGNQTKQQVQAEVCGCVGQKATTSITVTDLMVAAMDKTSQANLASKVVANTLNACVVETFKN